MKKYARISVFATLFTLAAMTSAVSAHADDKGDSKVGYLGVLFGANLPNGNSTSATSPNLGATIGAKMNPFLGLGFYGTYYGQVNNGSFLGLPVGTQTTTVNLAAEINAMLSIVHVGADVGMAINSWGGNAGSATISSSNTALIYGPEAGVDLPIGNALSIGADVHYLLSNASGAQPNLLALASLKIWL